jgi:hypothetical protein
MWVSIEKELQMKRLSLTFCSLVLAAAIAASGASAKRMHKVASVHSQKVAYVHSLKVAAVHSTKVAARSAVRAAF